MRAPLALPALFLLVALGCATAQRPSAELRTHGGDDDYFTLDLSADFRPALPPHDQYDAFFLWRDRDWMVGIIMDGPAETLERLDEAVRINAVGSELDAEIVRVREAALGGLVARRTEIVLEVEGAKVLMLNTHTATEDQNVQLIVSGPLDDARALRELADGLEAGAFRFHDEVRGLIAAPPYDIEDPTLPVRFSAVPQGWISATRGSVNEHAFLELNVPEKDLWFMGIREELDDEQLASVQGDAGYLDRVARLMHDEMAAELQAVPPGDLEPFAWAGGGDDKRWSLGGVYLEGGIAITYRFRIVRRGREIVRLYCWGQPVVDVKGECDVLFDAITLAASER